MIKKKAAQTLTLAGLLFTSEAVADVNESCPQSTPCCFEECSPENCFYVGADYLYWRVWQQRLDRAGTGPLFTGNIEALEFNWSSGFRVTAGADFCSDWGVSATYTYLRPEGSKIIQANSIFPTAAPMFVAGGVNFLGGPVFFDIGEAKFSSVASEIELNYNLIDVELSKFICCDQCFDLQFSTGVQIAFIDETVTDIYRGNLLIAIDQVGFPTMKGAIPFQFDWRQSWDFDGVGLRLGSLGKYQVGCGFFVSSDFHIALLFGKYKNRNNRTIPLFDTSSLSGELIGEAPFFATVFNEYYLLTMTENFHDFVSNCQLNLGIGWEYWCKCVGFRLSAAYEVFYWWDLAIFCQGLAGNAAMSSADPNQGQFLFAGTSSSTKSFNQVGLHGLVVSLDIVF